MHNTIKEGERAALERLLSIAYRDTGQSKRVADFLLAWWNSQGCGGFDLTHLWNLDHAISQDMFVILGLINRLHHYPDAYGYGDKFEQLVRLWRPHLLKQGSEAPDERTKTIP